MSASGSCHNGFCHKKANFEIADLGLDDAITSLFSGVFLSSDAWVLSKQCCTSARQQSAISKFKCEVQIGENTAICLLRLSFYQHTQNWAVLFHPYDKFDAKQVQWEGKIVAQDNIPFALVDPHLESKDSYDKFDAKQVQWDGKIVAQDNIPFALVDPHLESKEFEIPRAELLPMLCQVMELHLPAEYRPQVLASQVHKSLETRWGMKIQLAGKCSQTLNVPTCLLVFEWVGYMKQGWNVHMVYVLPRLEDLLADAHLQQTVASKMEEAKQIPSTVRGTFTTYPCEKPSSPAPRASSLLRPAKIAGQSLVGSSSMMPYRQPASLTSTLKRARITDEVKLAEFIQTLATLFPAECRNPAYVENLVTTAAHSKLCGAEVSYTIKPSPSHYEVGRLSVVWVEGSRCWDVIFLSLDNQGCANISCAEVSTHFSHRINSLRKKELEAIRF
jgi:hypothetical protein